MACKLYYKSGRCSYALGTFRNRQKAEEFWYFIHEALMDKIGQVEPIYVETRKGKEKINAKDTERNCRRNDRKNDS